MESIDISLVQSEVKIRFQQYRMFSVSKIVLFVRHENRKDINATIPKKGN